MDMKSDDGLHSFSFAKLKYFPSDNQLHSFSFAKLKYFPSDNQLQSFSFAKFNYFQVMVALFLFTTFKDFPSKDGLHSLFVHKHSNTSHSNNANLRCVCGKGAISFAFLILV